MNFARGEAEGEIHVIWGISYFTSRGLYTVFLTDVGRKWQFPPAKREGNGHFRPGGEKIKL